LSALACAAAQFGDYWRLGLPLSVMVAVLGTWLITIVLGFTQQSVSKATFSNVSWSAKADHPRLFSAARRNDVGDRAKLRHDTTGSVVLLTDC